MQDSRANAQYPQPQYNGTAVIETTGTDTYPQPTGYQQQSDYPKQNVYQEQPRQDSRKIRDWLCWSIFSLIFGGGLLGCIPLIFSIICRSKKKINDYVRAQLMSTLALTFNIIITILGLIGWIIFIVGLVLYSQGYRGTQY